MHSINPMFHNSHRFLQPRHTLQQGRRNFGPRNFFQGDSQRNHFFTRTKNEKQNQISKEEYWCETCDRGFQTEKLLQNHKEQHQKCNIDGCQFVAHPKVITKHIQMQHSSGLYKKIAKLDNPEQIQKWREERKNKYPTRENIEKKAAIIKEKVNRGEKMGLKYGYETEKRKWNNKSGIGGKRKQSFANEIHSHKQISKFKKRNINAKKPKENIKKCLKVLPLVENKRNLQPFTGILNLGMGSDTEEIEEDSSNCLIDDIDLDDSNELAKQEISQQPSTLAVCGALSALMCNYESSDDEMEILQNNKTDINKLSTDNDVSKPKEEKCIKAKNISDVIEKNRNTNVSDDESGPDEVKNIKCNDKDTSSSENVTVVQKKYLKDIKKPVPYQRKPRPKLPSTLLEKLLFNEIRQERNIVLQCIRHVVKNNYFDKS